MAKDKKDKKSKKKNKDKSEKSSSGGAKGPVAILSHDGDLTSSNGNPIPAITRVYETSGRVNYMLSNVRCSYPHLFEKPSFDNGEGSRGMKVIFDMNDERDMAIKDELMKLIMETHDAKESWKEKPLGKDRLALREDASGAWAMSANASGDAPIRVIAPDGKTLLTQQNTNIYSGCYVNCRISIWRQNTHGGRVNVQLIAAQYCRDGEPLDGKTVLEEDAVGGFEAMDVAPAQENF